MSLALYACSSYYYKSVNRMCTMCNIANVYNSYYLKLRSMYVGIAL